MKNNLKRIFQVVMVMVVCLVLTSGFTESVQAGVTCTWEGDGNTDWTLAGNWDCGHVPVTDDDVTIPNVTNDPVIYSNFELPAPIVASITLQTGATLTINSGMSLSAVTWNISGSLIANAVDSPISLLGSGSVNVNPGGNITKLGIDDLFIYPTFNNAGSVLFTDHHTWGGGIVLNRGGEHTGNFEGHFLYIGFDATGQTYNFNSGSEIKVTQILARAGTVNIYGTYWPIATGSYLIVQPSGGTCTVNFKAGASVVRMAENTQIQNGGKLILEPQATPYAMQKLSLEYGGELQNLHNLSINTKFDWKQGKISGSGTTDVQSDTVFTMGASIYSENSFILDGQTLYNHTTANWNARDLTLANAAVFENHGIFKANATTTMSGGETVSFINDGEFQKNTAATTTTMNVGFTNNDNVQVNAGTLVFPLGMINSGNVVINLGTGSLDPGETLSLDSGDSLVGSGTLSANLTNGGTVSPGESPGIITVDGDYTQDADGVLEIELGGASAGTGYDQLVVTGSAILHGTLTVSLYEGFIPTLGQVFDIITHGTGTYQFDTENLPALPGGLALEIAYSDPGVTLTVVGGNFYIFLPLVLR